MKSASKLLAAFLVLGSPSVAYAQTPTERPATPSPQAVPCGSMMGKDLQTMQAAMTKMQELMTKMSATSDPAERQKFMREHMSTMQEAMGTMMKTGGPGTGMMPGGGMMAGPAGTPTPGEMPSCMGMMAQRMGMMQIMMDQMMQHQKMMDPGH